ncbi:4-hydroxylaminobenzoate lyase [Derxia lacustris]|uniref:4-hydroxylaminobenzoate lyase n=1 Tax=Derxia lacustris TaxID=764842 RepID=UPI000A177159|nr:DUF4863 family protein [Derxia lacustris]
MAVEEFRTLIQGITSTLSGAPLDAALAARLNAELGPASPGYRAVLDACRQGIAEGWMCDREGGGLRYGRVLRADDATHRFSVDVVDMTDLAGPLHTHPNGEIDLVMPLDGDARFDGHGAGWVVYGPGSQHRPTVSGGRALVLYLLPEGAIEFHRS